MEQTYWKWVAHAGPRKPRRRRGSPPPGQAGRGVRLLWLNSEAVDVAEHCADASGMRVERFVERVLFDICGAPPRPKRSADRSSGRAARAPAAVIRIDRQRRR